MAIDLINIGQFANDGTGDDLREAFIKINNNFEDLDLRNDEKTTAVNLGNIGEGVFSQRNSYELEFKKLVAGTDITLESDSEKIVITANGGLKKITVEGDSGSVELTETDNISFVGGENISTTIVDNTLIVDYTGPVKLEDDINPKLSNTLNAVGYDIINVGNIDSSLVSGAFQGNLTGTVYNIDIRNINQYFDNYLDFGTISGTIMSIIEWTISETVVDMGTITNPELRLIDAGTISIP